MRRSIALEIAFALFLGLALTGAVWAVLLVVYPRPGYEQPGWQDWPIIASILLVVAATLSMVVSLTIPDRMRVIANGVLFGGLFLMFTGGVYTLDSDRPISRLLIMLAALAVTVIVGYLRFSRRSEAPVAADTPSSELVARVGELERRLAAVSDALR